MAALTGNKERRVRNLEGMKRGTIVPVAATQFYEGQVISSNATGGGVPHADTANYRPLGIMRDKVLSAASAPTGIEFEWGHEEWFPCNANLQAIAATTGIGKNATWIDDNTLGLAADAPTAAAKAGTVTSFEVYKGTNGAWVSIGILANLTA